MYIQKSRMIFRKLSLPENEGMSLEKGPFKRKVVFQPSIFRGYVIFQGCMSFFLQCGGQSSTLFNGSVNSCGHDSHPKKLCRLGACFFLKVFKRRLHKLNMMLMLLFFSEDIHRKLSRCASIASSILRVTFHFPMLTIPMSYTCLQDVYRLQTDDFDEPETLEALTGMSQTLGKRQ